jgi:membrane protease YdiL (CAAX protease family)
MISEKSWSVEEVARLSLGVMATLCVGIFLCGIFDAPKLHLSAEQFEFLQTVVMVVFFQGSALVWIALFLRRSHTSWNDAFGLNPASVTKVLVIGLGAGAVALPVMLALQGLSQVVMGWLHLNPVAQLAVNELENSVLNPAEKIVFGALVILVAPAAEEALFRGILYPVVKQTGHPRLALWGSAVLFGLMHLNMAAFLPLTALAVVLTLLYEYTGSLFTPMAAHALFNAYNFLYLIIYHPAAPLPLPHK